MTSRAVFSAQQTPATPYFPPLCSDAAYSRLNEDDGEPPAHTLIPAPVTTRAWRRSSLSGIDLDELRDQSTYFLCAIQGFVRSNAGLLLIMLAQLFFACMNVSVKLLNSLDPPVPALELIAVRMVITYVFCIAYMYSTNVPHPYLGPPGVRFLLLIRGIVGFFSLFGVYYALQYLSLSDTTVLTFLTPFFTVLAGAALLGEQVRGGELVAGLLSLGGVILIARPAFLFGGAGELENGVSPQQRLTAVGVALVGVIGATCAYITMRAIGKRAHALHSMAFFSSLCVLVSSIAMPMLRVPPVLPTDPKFVALLLVVGLSGFTAQALLTLGLQRETAGRGSAGQYVQIVFAAAFERVVLGVRPPMLSVVGAVVIVGCGAYVALTKAREGGGQGKAAERGPEAEVMLLEERASSNIGEDVRSELDLDELERELEGEAKTASVPSAKS